MREKFAYYKKQFYHTHKNILYNYGSEQATRQNRHNSKFKPTEPPKLNSPNLHKSQKPGPIPGTKS